MAVLRTTRSHTGSCHIWQTNPQHGPGRLGNKVSGGPLAITSGTARGRDTHLPHNCYSSEKKLLRETALPNEPHGQCTFLCYAGQGQGCGREGAGSRPPDPSQYCHSFPNPLFRKERCVRLFINCLVPHLEESSRRHVATLWTTSPCVGSHFR